MDGLQGVHALRHGAPPRPDARNEVHPVGRARPHQLHPAGRLPSDVLRFNFNLFKVLGAKLPLEPLYLLTFLL